MAYWCDDQALNLEQRRLDADQARAKRRIEALAARKNAKEAAKPAVLASIPQSSAPDRGEG